MYTYSPCMQNNSLQSVLYQRSHAITSECLRVCQTYLNLCFPPRRGREHMHGPAIPLNFIKLPKCLVQAGHLVVHHVPKSLRGKVWGSVNNTSITIGGLELSSWLKVGARTLNLQTDLFRPLTNQNCCSGAHYPHSSCSQTEDYQEFTTYTTHDKWAVKDAYTYLKIFWCCLHLGTAVLCCVHQSDVLLKFLPHQQASLTASGPNLP